MIVILTSTVLNVALYATILVLAGQTAERQAARRLWEPGPDAIEVDTRGPDLLPDYSVKSAKRKGSR